MTTQLQKKALLVWFRASQWHAVVSDRQVASNVTTSAGATSGSVQVLKDLGLKDHLSLVRKATNDIKQQHEKYTLPWDFNWKQRILPLTLYRQYQKELDRANSQRDSSIDDFLRRYPGAIEDARDSLQTIFKKDDYPTEDQIKFKFRINSSFLLLPDTANFVTDLNPNDEKRIKTEIENHMSRCIRNAIGSLYGRISHDLHRVINQTKPIQEEKPAQVRDDAFYSLHELVNIGPHLNLIDDPKLDQIFEKIGQAIIGVTVDMFRPHKADFNEKTRKRVHIELSKIQKEYGLHRISFNPVKKAQSLPIFSID